MIHKTLGFNINKNDIFIGLGHKARQGKDTVGLMISDELKKHQDINFIPLKFVDSLIKELENPLLEFSEKNYLINSTNLPDSKTIYYIADKLCENNNRYIYRAMLNKEVPKLHKIFQERNIINYKKMYERDPEIMQFWGVDYRREDDDYYWIKKTLSKIEKIQEDSKNRNCFIFTDLRFKNELNILKQIGGHYIKVLRLNEDGSQFIDKERDHKHISENDLNDVISDYIICAKTNEIDSLNEQTRDIMNNILLF